MTDNLRRQNIRHRWIKTLIAALMVLSVPLLVTPVWGARIKDIAHLQGTRIEQLIGYGLVVGLEGTGDSRTIFTNRSTASLLNKFGVEIQGDEINAANVAAVMVTAELESFVKPGSRIDVTVSSIGEAESLQGGTLLRTQLFGYDGKSLYAVCQGSVSIGGFVVGAAGAGAGAQIQRNHTVVGRIPGGAQVLKSIESNFIENWQLMLTLESSDFTSKIVQFISTLENLEITPDVAAKVVINERTGTIAIGENVSVLPVQVSHGALTITVGTGVSVSQPTTPLGGGAAVLAPTAEAAAVEEIRKFMEIRGTAGDLVTALNRLQVSPRDIIAIFQAIKQAGALAAELVIM